MWSVHYAPEAIKTLRAMDRGVAGRVRAKILALAQDPHAPNTNAKKLKGTGGYRLRVGDWRVIYMLEHKVLTVVVIRIGHRSEVYT